MKTIIGIAGRRGSGKTTFVTEAREILAVDFAVVRISDVLRDTLKEWNIAVTVANMQSLSDAMQVAFGSQTLAHAIESKIAAASEEVVLVDGVRGPNIARVVRSYHPSTLIYVETPVDERYARLHQRDEKIGESILSEKEHEVLDRHRSEDSVEALRASCDRVIFNGLSRGEYREEVRSSLRELGLPVH